MEASFAVLGLVADSAFGILVGHVLALVLFVIHLFGGRRPT
jgi:hypothetical protein